MSDPVQVIFKKADDEMQVVYGEVYAPSDLPDSQDDRMSADEIMKASYHFMKMGRLSKIDTQHDRKDNGSYVVESFIARDGDPTFIPGSWVMGVKVPDTKLWKMVKSGELNGFSFDGEGFRTTKTVSVEVPDEVSGLTESVSEHAHQFIVKFDDDGKFVGGETDIVNGHKHKITRGTATEAHAGHTHRFADVEGAV
jgi:hypothetical protein